MESCTQGFGALLSRQAPHPTTAPSPLPPEAPRAPGGRCTGAGSPRPRSARVRLEAPGRCGAGSHSALGAGAPVQSRGRGVPLGKRRSRSRLGGPGSLPGGGAADPGTGAGRNLSGRDRGRAPCPGEDPRGWLPLLFLRPVEVTEPAPVPLQAATATATWAGARPSGSRGPTTWSPAACGTCRALRISCSNSGSSGRWPTAGTGWPCMTWRGPWKGGSSPRESLGRSGVGAEVGGVGRKRWCGVKGHAKPSETRG